MPKVYDYIIAGSGLSGLLMAYRMAKDPWFTDKKILLIDKDLKSYHDRTWCFWEKEGGEWDDILTHHWKAAEVADKNFRKTFALDPFVYKMIRSGDFYRKIFSFLDHCPNISFVVDTISNWTEDAKGISIFTEKTIYNTSFLLNSLWNPASLEEQKKYPYLKQHFTGWFIKTNKKHFDRSTVTFMDFSIPQKGNCRFMYVLPLSEKEALVEYTLFSETLLDPSEYENAIKTYLRKKGITEYEIIEKEYGNIPMCGYAFHKNNSKRIIHIGTAGGWTKASTGYTFYNSCKQSKKLADFLKTGKELSHFHTTNRFLWYDRIFLEVLSKHNHLGSDIFVRLFQRNLILSVLTFLNEESSLFQELKLILSLQKRIFIGGLARLIKKI